MTQIEKLAETMSTAIKGWTQRKMDDLRLSLLETVKGMVEAIPPARDGRDGLDGKDGAPGIQGEKGLAGERGMDGAAGSDGPQGEQGPAGDKGERGEQGPQGERGEKGDAGEMGAPGAAGEPGPEGPQGAPGAAGVAGEKGERGEDGKTVTPDEVRAMLDEIVIKHLPGMLTKAVSDLPPAAAGKDADPEPIYQRVLADVKTMFAEIPKPQDGRDGQKGEPGRDAIYISPLSAIDESKQYARGTYASHKGGFWHAFKTTEGMDGWECLVNGVESIDCIQSPEDPRQIAMGIKTTKGEYVIKEMHVPFVIDRGVFKEGQEYKSGDGVTWARNYWIATKDTGQKPDYGNDWRLCVKGGRDGKDGRDGIDKTAAVKL